ncbi:hypothetical protein JJQ25_22895, partial [Enterobacter cloacae]|nr:hypothetical protein [Enterobacter cloacae]
PVATPVPMILPLASRTVTVVPSSAVPVSGVPCSAISIFVGVATGGTFTIALSPAQLDATTLTLIATAAAGNASPSTTFAVPESPLALPAVPVITA